MKLLTTLESKSVSGGVFMDKFENTYKIYVCPNELFGMNLNGKTYLFDVNGVKFEHFPAQTTDITSRNCTEFGISSFSVENANGYISGSVAFTLTFA